MQHTQEHEEAHEPSGNFFLRHARKQPNFGLSVVLTSLKMFLIVACMVVVGVSGALLGLVKIYSDTVPELDLTALDDQALTSSIFDKNGVLLTTFKGQENRIRATSSEIPQHLKDAVVAIEDARFYSHYGVDIKGIMRAFVSNVTTGSTQGGSTITQQIVKNTLLTSEVSYKRKIQEAYLSIELETKFNKDAIITYYLNLIWLGGSNYGVKVAAQDYFGKELEDLTLRESAMLAAIIRSPNKYDPRKNYYVNLTPDVIEERTDFVLLQMYHNGFITEDVYQQALLERVNVLETSGFSAQSIYDYAYYVEYAVHQIVTDMLSVRGMEDTVRNRSAIENELRSGGYQITLAVDPEVQSIMEDTIVNWDKYPQMRDPNKAVSRERNGDGTYTDVLQPQASSVVIERSTNTIAGLVGGRQLPTRLKQLNRAYQAAMPIGSAIKPIAIYGPALDLLASPSTVVYNMPVAIDGWLGGEGFPRNYGGASYIGAETLREALTRSHNTAAAQALYGLVGVENAYNYLLSMGVSENKLNHDGAGMVLGSSGISMLDLAGAYSTIGNGGEYIRPMAYLQVLDSSGNLVLDGQTIQEASKHTVFQKSTAWMLLDMMKDVVQSAAGTGKSARISGMTVAGKTGTSSDNTSVTFAGLTPHYVGSVWVGHDRSYSLSSSATGGGGAAPIWQSFMEKIHTQKGLKDEPFFEETPEELGLVKVEVCAYSGLPVSDACKAAGHPTVTDWFALGSIPQQKCDMHSVQTVCEESHTVAGPYCPAESTVTKSVFLIPASGHPLSKIDWKVLKQYMPYAYLEKAYDAQDPNIQCPIHTWQWAQENPQPQVTPTPAPTPPTDINTAVLRQQAQALRDQAFRLFYTHALGIPFATLNRGVALMDAVLSNQNATAIELEQAMDHLNQVVDWLNSGAVGEPPGGYPTLN